MYRSYAVLRVDRVVPVDIYISGCPPRPELSRRMMHLSRKIARSRPPAAVQAAPNDSGHHRGGQIGQPVWAPSLPEYLLCAPPTCRPFLETLSSGSPCDRAPDRRLSGVQFPATSCRRRPVLHDELASPSCPMSAVDWDQQSPRFGVFYHFIRVRKTFLARHRRRMTPLPSTRAHGIWASANWHEREVFDMFGIKLKAIRTSRASSCGTPTRTTPAQGIPPRRH